MTIDKTWKEFVQKLTRGAHYLGWKTRVTDAETTECMTVEVNGRVFYVWADGRDSWGGGNDVKFGATWLVPIPASFDDPPDTQEIDLGKVDTTPNWLIPIILARIQKNELDNAMEALQEWRMEDDFEAWVSA